MHARLMTSWVFSAFLVMFTAFAGDALAQSRPYDISGLDSGLRGAIESARNAQTRGLAAAARSQADVAGTVRFKGNAGDSYEGEGYGAGADAQRNGYGFLTWADGEFYAGQFRGGTPNAGVKEGYGVYVFADGRIYEGQWVNDLRHGYGVQWDAAGRLAFSGVWSDGNPPQ